MIDYKFILYIKKKIELEMGSQLVHLHIIAPSSFFIADVSSLKDIYLIETADISKICTSTAHIEKGKLGEVKKQQFIACQV